MILKLFGGLIINLNRKLVFAHEHQDDMKTIISKSNISVKITDWESGVVYGRVSFDEDFNPYGCYNRLIYKVSCCP